MEEPSRNLQLALATLAGLVVGTLMALYLVGSGILPNEWPASAGPMNGLFVAWGAIAGALLWWRHDYGYPFGMVTGVLFLVIMGFSLATVASGDMGVEWLVMVIPGIFFALVFLAATYLAWRER